MNPRTLALINATHAKRKAAGLVGTNGVAFATPEQKAYADARHGLTRGEIAERYDELTALRVAARRSEVTK